MELRAREPAAAERVEVEVARDPDLVDVHEPLEEHARDPVGLEHRARDGGAAIRERLAAPGNEMRDEDEVSVGDGPRARAVDRRDVRRWKARVGAEPRRLARGDGVAAALEREQECAPFVRIPGRLPERTVPEERELARHRLR